MKLNKKPTKPSLHEMLDDEEADKPSSSNSSFAVTDPAEFGNVAKAAKALSGGRAPELWVKDGTQVDIRFRSPEPVASFEVYRFKGPNGRWEKMVKPGEDEQDLAAEAGMRPQRVFVYEVNDLKGYKDKSGVRKKFLPRFYVVGIRQYEQLKLLAKGQGMPLTKFDITIARQGQGTQTTYMFMPKAPSPMPEEVKSAPRLDWRKYYYPLPVAAQRTLLGRSPSQGRDDE